ncbi:hypothetical protein [Nitrospina gracilis]|uniref:hypothetical protein n=1 Tax=Nitrospina gracilis TaxID=35801 RepID=UPI001F247E24|nr:hypothetical protein [Nitrospina gracilis]MCF8720655.1 hypothetical protein [Nitrospina gracilis Nb-211]
MKNPTVSRISFSLAFSGWAMVCLMFPENLWAGAGEAWIQAQWALAQSPTAGPCGESVPPLEFYETVSKYALFAAFGFIIPAILFNKKRAKQILGILGGLCLGAWSYLAYGIDYEEIKKTIFNYNLQAEQTLSNIAEAQDRYKSEHDTYIEDLGKLRSHLYGAHGIKQCVKILELNVKWDHWSAKAKHVSSPDTVEWDSTSGSSLKKG